MSIDTTDRYALFSVADKTGIDSFAKSLVEIGIKIIATGGTSKYLRDNGIESIKVEDITGFPHLFEGRVKTLHPNIFGGILADRTKGEHLKTASENKIPLIDIVVVNLYPFEETASKTDVSEDDAIENIDIGGVALIRAAAKNFHSVYVVTDTDDYSNVSAFLQNNDSENSLVFRRRLAEKAFVHTSNYDSVISGYLKGANGLPDEYPELMTFGFRKHQELRYGENPHQKATLYRNSIHKGVSLTNATIHSGKELSFNNIYDLESVLAILLDFDEPFAVVVKHTNPCGAASADTLAQAYTDALECDEMSAFGGIVGLNRVVDMETAQKIHKTFFLECIIAPGYEPDALELLVKKKNRRIVSVGDLQTFDHESRWEGRFVTGGLLVQSRDKFKEGGFDLITVTAQQPDDEQLKSLIFAMKIVKHIKSNAIVICSGTKTVGVGAGQTSRVDSAMIAVRKAGDKAKGAVSASDAFFPMPDGLETLTNAGVIAVIQPGGSKKDNEVIEAANNAGISMVFTGERHFKH
ncbi:MAG: bifunctional phosphoribosylaminoimidazolecarboxamide formyltransferase/IMP cyclohydrolase [candidate division Zixibacteria bacterium]|nr:bifunctional phosphoribosylaminoimidazolecarboxamide formyltransferase/IMP cyclohydrolase [candidate division Zixibacteria bacterium]